jgi:hydroxypyruvate isomerase
VDDATLLRRIRDIGYEAVELIDQAYFDQVRDSGLQIASHGGHRSIEHGLNDPREHDRIEREIKQNLALAQKYQIPNLIVFSGSRRTELSEKQGITHTVQGLRRVAPAAEEAGVTLVLELLNSKVDHHDYQCDHTAWGIEVCEQVGSPHVKLLYDFYHMQIMEGGIIASIRENSKHFAHYHTAGVPGRRDLDEAQELNYPAILRAVADTGYAGYVGHEFIPKGEPVAALQAAYDLTHFSI